MIKCTFLFSTIIALSPLETTQLDSLDVGICTIFGDPHYRTFDGRTYSFQGACRYILSTDCSPDPNEQCRNGAFAIIVQNDARYSQYSWTQNVTFMLYNQLTGSTSIKLLQELKVDINGIQVSLPYTGNGVKIFKEKHKIRMFSNIGISIVWDGRSMLEITANGKHRNNLNGLCGNFNGNSGDDFSTNEVVYPSAVDFANSWKLDISQGNRFCTEKPQKNNFIKNCSNSPISKQFRAHKECEIFKSEQFQRCYSKINPDFYHRSCLNDSCGDLCVEGVNCGCSALKSYTQHCAERGVKIHWQEHKHCTVQCTNGKIYTECGSRSCQSCNRYWKDANNVRSCSSKKCQQGCFCKKGYIVYKGNCILPTSCPKKYKAQGLIFDGSKGVFDIFSTFPIYKNQKLNRGDRRKNRRRSKTRLKSNRKLKRNKNNISRHKKLDFFRNWRKYKGRSTRRKMT